MDEFGTIRFPELNRAAGVQSGDPEKTVEAHPRLVERAVNQLMHEARQYLSNRLIPELAQAGIHIMSYTSLSATERKTIDAHFREAILPILTPIAFDPSRPFPHMANLSFNLGILIRVDSHTERFAYLRIPDSIPQLIPVFGDAHHRRAGYVWLEDVITANLPSIFQGVQIVESHKFRVMRNAEIAMED